MSAKARRRSLSEAVHAHFPLPSANLLLRVLGLSVSVYLLKGKEKHGGNPISVLFIGNPSALPYLCNIIYAEDPDRTDLGSTQLFRLHKILLMYGREADVIVVQSDRFVCSLLTRHGYFSIPEWVEMTLILPSSLTAYVDKLGSSAQKDIHDIERYRYTYEIAIDQEKLELFYHKMQLPYIEKRHRELLDPHFINYDDVQRNFHRGVLLLVKENEKYIAGSIIVTLGSTAYPSYLGVLDDDYYLPRGVGATLYYFPILWALEKSIRTINFGNSRPFLNSGDFLYKRKWDLRVQRSAIFYSNYAIRVREFNHQGTRDFCLHNPFIYELGSNLCGMITVAEPLTGERMDSLWKQYAAQGISKLTIFSYEPVDAKLREMVRAKHDDAVLLMDVKRKC